MFELKWRPSSLSLPPELFYVDVDFFSLLGTSRGFNWKHPCRIDGHSGGLWAVCSVAFLTGGIARRPWFSLCGVPSLPWSYRKTSHCSRLSTFTSSRTQLPGTGIKRMTKGLGSIWGCIFNVGCCSGQSVPNYLALVVMEKHVSRALAARWWSNTGTT